MTPLASRYASLRSPSIAAQANDCPPVDADFSPRGRTAPLPLPDWRAAFYSIQTLDFAWLKHAQRKPYNALQRSRSA